GAAAATGGISFETPSIADPIHTFGEPDIGIDPQGRVFVSGPTGTGTQRSVWFGSVDGGHSFRPISPGPPPSGITSFEAPPGAAAATGGISFETPSIADPIHTFGEPDIGIDPQGRVFVSGPTGTGTQRSVWFGSVDGGHSFRPISPGPPPSGITSFEAPPGGGDTDIAFDRSGKQYFIDLYALICDRVATTSDGGATAQQNVLGCGASPGSDRPWLAVYDPSPTTPHQSAYPGPP